MSCGLPDLLAPTAPTDAVLPDLVGYDDAVRVYRVGERPADPDTGRPVGDPAVTVVYEGEADVQDGIETLERLAEGAGESEGATAVCYLPPGAPFGDVRVDDRVDTPIGRGHVLETHRDGRALVLSLTSDAE